MDWKQTWQGGSEGWIKHNALGTALEQPVPRKISADLLPSTTPFRSSWWWFSILWISIEITKAEAVAQREGE